MDVSSERALNMLLCVGHAAASAWVVSSALEVRVRGTRWARLLFWLRRRPVRVWIDGCYDVTHFGHYNAFRQARALGDVLIVGLNSDAEVARHKGTPPLMTDEERFQMVSACKWVDTVVRDVPYVLDQKYLEEVVFGKYEVDLVVHGDDPCLDVDGNDVYATSKAVGKYREIKRTEGVSTTDLVGRMLTMTRDHHHSGQNDASFSLGFTSFMPTSRRVAEFASTRRPLPNDKVVYVDGAFDLLHPAQIDFLRSARALGDFLIVGVHKDEEVNKYKGSNFPIMNLHERLLAVLSCRYVDEVVIGAPWEVTEDLITTFNISVVAHGSFYDNTRGGQPDYANAYRVARGRGIFVEVPSSEGAVKGLVERVRNERER
ncbi:hypothetical protein T484DRAFT_1960345, partial [Baffinella frigidus]